jgi:thiol:disulfide interchange protein DsbD
MKKNITTIQTLFLLILIAQVFTFAQQKSLAEARLVVDSFSRDKDSVISIGVLINLKDDWHIYWRNPGDSGLPTEVEFIIPEDFTISEIKFPTPKIFYSDEIVNYGYAHQVLLIADLNIPKNYRPKEINISAKLTSLICKDLCKSFDTTLTLVLDLSKDFYPAKLISDLFNYTKSIMPVINPNIKIFATKISDSVSLKLNLNAVENLRTKSFEFYPFKAGVFKNMAKRTNRIYEKYIELELEPDPFRVENPTYINGIIVINNDHNKSYEIHLPITD